METRGAVLIVDDERSLRLTLAEALRGRALRIDAASRGKEALAMLRRGDYALVLLDLRMPGMSGLEVLREIERVHPEVPVVIMTAHGSVDTAVEAMRGGAFHVIQKPFGLDEIRALVDRVLDRGVREAAAAASYEEHIEQAAACVRGGALAAAAEHARRAMACDSRRPEAYNVLGVAYQLGGRRLDAIGAYQLACVRSPGYGPAIANLENLTGVWGPPRAGHYDLGNAATRP